VRAGHHEVATSGVPKNIGGFSMMFRDVFDDV
jgi:hypothetical protein